VRDAAELSNARRQLARPFSAPTTSTSQYRIVQFSQYRRPGTKLLLVVGLLPVPVVVVYQYQ
jgi:hypothetical protein